MNSTQPTKALNKIIIPAPRKKQRQVESAEGYNEQFPSEVRPLTSLTLVKHSAKVGGKPPTEHRPTTM